MRINIYDKTGKEVVKTYEAHAVDLMFGTVRNIFNLLKIDKVENDVQLAKTILGAWDEVLNILSNIFPEITDEEWDCVKVKELVPVVIGIVKDTFSAIGKIPTEKN